MRGIDQFNFPAFAAAAAELRSWGWTVLSPAERDLAEGFDPTLNSLEGFDLEAAMEADFRMIDEADGIVLLPGWEVSEGACRERDYALSTGKKILLYDNLRGESTLETRTTNTLTGGEKGRKLAEYALIPPGPLADVAKVYGMGAKKYAPRNWEQGYDWSLSFSALQRHAWLHWSGEDLDPESGLPHLAHVVFHCFSMLEWASTHPELDDRPRRG